MERNTMNTPLRMFVLLTLPCYSAHGQFNPFGIPVSVHAGKFYGMSPRDHICGGVNYRSLDFTCCEGVRHKGAGLSCCGKRAFSLTQASCCTYSLEPGQLTLNVSQLVSDCCGLRAYDPLNQLCCDSRILNRTQPHAKCCGKEPYDEDNQLCCGNIIEGRKVLAKMSSHHRCCGDHQFNQQSHCCCSETLSPEPLNASCCASSSSNYRGNDASSPNCMPGERPCGRGACFNPTTEGCCENPTSLQGKRYLRHQTCCEGILSRNPCKTAQGPYNVASCGSQVYNPDINICCAGQISHRVLGKNLCCGKTPYAVEDRRVLCCNQTLHRGVEAGHQCSPGGHLYLPSREIVCESRVHLNNPGKHCCGEETYNPQDEICCNGHKHRRLGNMSCCGGKAYDTSSGQMKCCAGTLYDLQVQGRLTEDAQCCGNILMEAGSTQTCCSAPGLDLLYPTQSGFTCCGHRYPNSSLWSCCAGVLHPRSERNTTSMNMIPGPRLLPLGDLKTEDLCYTEVLLGTVESVSMKMNERSIVMVNAMSLLASRGNVSTLPSPLYHTLPDHCSSPELVPGNTYIWVKTGFISDLSDHSSPLHSILSRC
ncbi:usherin-like isoform X1 [Oncorhynchus keta]|uniref:usherin-like isoform X1 n=2 Tax=Oncorhynchus keta TaxID=8018 RepID=UPI0015F7D948|nr:usherin-like isoform X1 [Oncorhynchus keta]